MVVQRKRGLHPASGLLKILFLYACSSISFHVHAAAVYALGISDISERDLRKARNRQKMPGGFRKESSYKMYCSILTVIETLKRRNMELIENIKMLFIETSEIF